MTDFHDTVRILLFNSDRLKAPLNTSTDSSDGLSLHFADNPSKFTTTETSPGIVRAQKRGAIFTLFLPLFFSFSRSLSHSLESCRCLCRGVRSLSSSVVSICRKISESINVKFTTRLLTTGRAHGAWELMLNVELNAFHELFVP